jgi:hypothetical protein
MQVCVRVFPNCLTSFGQVVVGALLLRLMEQEVRRATKDAGVRSSTSRIACRCPLCPFREFGRPSRRSPYETRPYVDQLLHSRAQYAPPLTSGTSQHN